MLDTITILAYTGVLGNNVTCAHITIQNTLQTKRRKLTYTFQFKLKTLKYCFEFQIKNLGAATMYKLHPLIEMVGEV